MRGWSFPSNQDDGEEEIESEKQTFFSVSLATKLAQINQSLAIFEEQLQTETNCLKLPSKNTQDLNMSTINISDQEMMLWDMSDQEEMMMWDLSNLSSSMSSGIAWVGGAESLLKSDSLIAMTSILRNGNESGGSSNGKEEKLILGSTISSFAHLSIMGADVRHPEAQDLELASAGRVHQEVDEEEGRVHREVNEEEKKKLPRYQIRGRAVSAVFWLLRKISRSHNRQL